MLILVLKIFVIAQKKRFGKDRARAKAKERIARPKGNSASPEENKQLLATCCFFPDTTCILYITRAITTVNIASALKMIKFLTLHTRFNSAKNIT